MKAHIIEGDMYIRVIDLVAWLASGPEIFTRDELVKTMNHVNSGDFNVEEKSEVFRTKENEC